VGATPTPATSLRPLPDGGRRLSRRNATREDGPYSFTRRATARQAIFGK